MNVFACLGVPQGGCAAGAEVSLVDCGLVDAASSQFRWDGARVASVSCPGLCLSVDAASGRALLGACGSEENWARKFLD